MGKKVRRALRKLQERRQTWWEFFSPSEGWKKVWPQRVVGGYTKGRVVPPEDVVKVYEMMGIRVRRRRRRACARRVVPIWGEASSVGVVGPEVKRLELLDTEVHSFAPSLYFTADVGVRRLVEFSPAHRFRGRDCVSAEE